MLNSHRHPGHIVNSPGLIGTVHRARAPLVEEEQAEAAAEKEVAATRGGGIGATGAWPVWTTSQVAPESEQAMD